MVDVCFEFVRVYVLYGDLYVVVELFCRMFMFECVCGCEDDWCEFVCIYCDGVGDVVMVYNF